MEFYSSFLKLAPLLLLKLLSARGSRHSVPSKEGRGRVAFVGDVLLIAVVVVGAFTALFVLGDVLPSTAATRGWLVVGGCLSLVALGVHEVRQIASMYRIRPRSRTTSEAPGRGARSPEESS